ncbi:MAG: SGNH/GDSL hydrolase family protein [Clostridia bacterium]|nr:SGNH/GDSL hydrolase family protein [Clostridia bacterium]
MKLRKSFRNLAIVLLGLLLIAFGSELAARSGDGKKSEKEEAQAENDLLFKMQLERGPYKNEYKLLNYPSGKKISSYPLIDNMPGTEIYDDDTVEILVVGDSFVWGYASLNRNELYWRQLETSLRRQGYNVRVDAVGFPGVSSFAELRWFTETSMLDDLKPDIVVIGYVQDDARLPLVSFRSDEENLADNTLDIVDLSDTFPLQRQLSKVFPSITGMTAMRILKYKIRHGAEYFYTEAFVPILNGDTRREYIENFVEPLDALASARGLDVIVMNQPSPPDDDLLALLSEPLGEIFSGCRKVKYYDCLDAFHGSFEDRKHQANYTVNIADDHPGSATSFFYAQYLENVLKTDYAQILGPSSGKDLTSPEIAINDWLPGGAAPERISGSGNEAVYRLTYPGEKRSANGGYVFNNETIEPYFLTLPLGKHHIRMSFEHPTPLARAELSGEGLESAELYYACINEELGYDDHSLRPFGERQGSGVWVNGSGEQITSLCICADIADRDACTLTLKLTAAD